MIESNNITTSWPHSTNRFAFSSTILAIFTCSEASLSKVEEIISPRTLRCISVTSSGRSSIKSTIRYTSGWFLLMAFAISFKSIVLPVLGCATIIPRCPFPIGAKRSIKRVETVEPLPANSNFTSGKRGVRCSNSTRSRTTWGSSPFIFITFSSG